MSTLLHVSASPRGASSESRALAGAFLDTHLRAHPEVSVEELALLLRAGVAAPEDGQLGFSRETAELRELLVEQVELFHGHLGVRPQVGV